MKGFVLAGTGSGSGKTTAALAVMAWLNDQGYRVAPFKVGPDFIDPGHHTAVTGQVSRNLDSWMLSREYNRSVFARACQGADVAVVEGVMGLFDGYSGTSEAGSTAQMAKWLGLPVILVVDARSMARSAAAIVQGFENFDPDLTFAGVLFSRTGSPRHYDYLKSAVEASCRMPCLGFLPRNDAVSMPERHLGLVTTDEHGIDPEVRKTLSDMVDRYTAIGGLVRELPDLDMTAPDRSFTGPAGNGRKGEVRIAVARDPAFCFYYQDNLDLIEAAGGRLAWFSPISDTTLPEDIHGIYLGGGYPELFAETLSANTAMLRSIREKSLAGMPIYGECGGFMYLCSTITDMDGRRFPMTGCFDLSASMAKRLRSLGYREINLTADTLIGRTGDVFRGHEFHYSTLDREPSAGGGVANVYEMSRRDGIDRMPGGYQVRSTLGSYVHVHFGSSPGTAEALVRACRRFQETGGV